MLGWKLLSCLMFPSNVASAFRSLILVFSCSCSRTYCSLGVQSGHFQRDSLTSIGTEVPLSKSASSVAAVHELASSAIVAMVLIKSSLSLVKPYGTCP